MTDLGKIERAAFDSIVAPRLGATRDDVALGPTHGVDFGVLSVGDRAVVIATDPLSVLPALGLERAGGLALDIVLADVAVSGIAPTHVAVSLSLPPDFGDDDLLATWTGLAEYAETLGVAIVAGHTARYPGIDTSWVGAGTALGVGDQADLIRPDGARLGDALVVGTGPGAEIAGLFASLFGDSLGLSDADLAAARERSDDIETVRDALVAARAGDVSAIHDATEGGLLGAFTEMAAGAGVGFAVERAAVPGRAGVLPVCEAIDVDPWAVSSAGTVVVTVDPTDADAVGEALETNGTPAAVVGSVVDGEGVRVDGEPVEPPESDPSWAAFAALADSR
jgi:hydrogenase expression/formation protein HypE